jgi:cysteine synthase A
MMFPGVTGTAGRTPLVELGRLAAVVPGRVVAKREMRNPCGSDKTGSVLRWPKTPNAVAS